MACRSFLVATGICWSTAAGAGPNQDRHRSRKRRCTVHRDAAEPFTNGLPGFSIVRPRLRRVPNFRLSLAGEKARPGPLSCVQSFCAWYVCRYVLEVRSACVSNTLYLHMHAHANSHLHVLCTVHGYLCTKARASAGHPMCSVCALALSSLCTWARLAFEMCRSEMGHSTKLGVS